MELPHLFARNGMNRQTDEAIPFLNGNLRTILICLSLFRMGIFEAAHGWGWGKKSPPSFLKSVTMS